MTKNPTAHTKILEEVAKFQQSMDELHLIKNVSNDLKNYKRMLHIKHND